jgi:hypothetical protein
MTDLRHCERCRKIQMAIKDGLSPHDAREANGWDECSKDGCPMQPMAFGFKTYDDRVLRFVIPIASSQSSHFDPTLAITELTK